MKLNFPSVVLSCVPVLAAPLLAFPQGVPDRPDHLGPAVNSSYMDRTIRPGDDFYRFASGDWLKRAQIPPDSDYIAVGSVLIDRTDQRIASLITEAVNSGATGGKNTGKVANLYRSFMDEATIERKGLAPLQPHLTAIANIRNKRELARALGETLRADVDGLNNTNFHTTNLFGLWVTPGFNDPTRYAAYLMQGGLGLPDREYYLSTSPEMIDLRGRYQRHVAAILNLAGFSEAPARAARVIELERAIAEKHVSLTESNDILKADNAWERSDFGRKAPGLDWAEYFRGAGLSQQSSFIVWQPSGIAGESALVASVELETWKDWLAYHLVETYAPALPKAVSDERYDFFEKALTGTTEQRPRWKTGVDIVNRYLGDAVGQEFAARYFSAEAKAQVESMVANIKAVYRRRIDAVAWMDPATKAEAQAKLDNLYVAVGYPEVWRDYSSYEVRADDCFGNLWRGYLYEYNRSIVRLGQAVDRREWAWGFGPQVVDTFELPLQNALDLPAAFFQPPYFDPNAPAAANYAAAGQSIGHEISHIFDSQGSLFDSTGRVRNWWKAADLEHFNELTARLVKQYDNYKPLPDLAVSGKQTLAENIADLAGLAAAYDGFKASRGSQPAPVHGFTDDQQFFLAYAQSWPVKDREASLRKFILTDMHSPPEFRVDTVRNFDAWYTAFDVKPGEKLYLAPVERIQIW